MKFFRSSLPLLFLTGLARAQPLLSPETIQPNYEEKSGPAAQGSKPNMPVRELEKIYESLLKITALSADSLTDGQLDTATNAALETFVNALKKPHSEFMNRQSFQNFSQEMNGSFVGVGVGVEPDPAGLKVTGLFPDSPAQKAGLQAGDVITEVNSVPAAGRPLPSVIEMIGGTAGTTVRLTIRRGAQTLTIPVVRGAIVSPNTFTRMVEPGIGYLYFNEFGYKTAADVFQRLDALRAQGAKKLILDVRFNPGGSLGTVNEIASQFLHAGQVIVTSKRRGQIESQQITIGDGRYAEMPLIVLVNAHSASASEILAGALQDHKRALIIGERTYGKGSVQVLSPLVSDSGKSAIKITTAKWFTPNDRTIQGQIDPKTDREIPSTGGVIPDVTVALDEKQTQAAYKTLLDRLYGKSVPTETKDVQFDKALEILRAQR